MGVFCQWDNTLNPNHFWLVVWLPFFIFPYIGFIIIPIDFHIFQRGGPTTNQLKNCQNGNSIENGHLFLGTWLCLRMEDTPKNGYLDSLNREDDYYPMDLWIQYCHTNPINYFMSQCPILQTHMGVSINRGMYPKNG